MDINVYLFIVIALMLLIIMYLLFVLRRVRTQLALIKDALEDIKGGNLNRRILAGENDMTKTICYDIQQLQFSCLAPIKFRFIKIQAGLFQNLIPLAIILIEEIYQG